MTTTPTNFCRDAGEVEADRAHGATTRRAPAPFLPLSACVPLLLDGLRRQCRTRHATADTCAGCLHTAKCWPTLPCHDANEQIAIHGIPSAKITRHSPGQRHE